MQTHIALNRAINLAGSQSDLARLLEVDRRVVHNWTLTGHIPPKRILQLMGLRPEWFKQPKEKK